MMIGNGEHGMLQHPRIVGHAAKMIQLQRRQIVDFISFGGVCAKQAGVPHALGPGPLKAAHVVLGNAFPNHIAGVQIRALTHRVPFGFIFQEFDGLLGNGLLIVEWDQNPATLIEKLLCMPIRSRDDRFASTQSVGQGSRNDLCLVLVRRDVDVGCTDEFHHLLGADKTVVEYDFRLHSRASNCNDSRYLSPSRFRMWG